MPRTIRIEKRHRKFVGWPFLLFFWAFNALMAVGILAGISGNAERGAASTSEAEQAG